jgi:AcrR family transcriptional regulator
MTRSFLACDAVETATRPNSPLGQLRSDQTEDRLHFTVSYVEDLFHLIQDGVSELRHSTEPQGGEIELPTAEVLPPAATQKRLRSDAVRNRQLVLDAAAEVFAECGLDVGYEEIARRAGVGVGTVYRRFPQRADLVMALFESRVDDVVELAALASEQPDGWSALSWLLEAMLAIQASDRGLQEVLAGSGLRDERVVHVRGRVVPAVSAVLNRAKDEGAVRLDVEPSDIGALMMVISSMSTAGQPELWRRYLALFLDALRPHPAGVAALPMTAPTESELEELAHSRRRAR